MDLANTLVFCNAYVNVSGLDLSPCLSEPPLSSSYSLSCHTFLLCFHLHPYSKCTEAYSFSVFLPWWPLHIHKVPSVVSQLVLFILVGSWGRVFFWWPCSAGCALPLLNIKYTALLDHSYEEGEINLHTITWHLNFRFAPDFCLMTVWHSTVLFVRSMHYVPYVIDIVHLAGHLPVEAKQDLYWMFSLLSSFSVYQ
jgi:hypothetical protein